MDGNPFNGEEMQFLFIYAAVSGHFDRPGLTGYMKGLRTKCGPRRKKDQAIKTCIVKIMRKSCRLVNRIFSASFFPSANFLKKIC